MMWRRFVTMLGNPDAVAVAGALFAVSAAGNRMLGGPDVVVGAFGLLAAGCFGAAITVAAMRHERGPTR